jgi:hypothetical protein
MILAEPAGARLDSWVAEFVMGWEARLSIEDDSRDRWVKKLPPGSEYMEEFTESLDWSPSTDLAAAWTVVEKIRDTPDPQYHNNLGFSLAQKDRLANGLWYCEMEISRAGAGGIGVISVSAKTAPLAISRCALLTMIGD